VSKTAKQLDNSIPKEAIKSHPIEKRRLRKSAYHYTAGHRVFSMTVPGNNVWIDPEPFPATI
jgi:hypothetical protein